MKIQNSFSNKLRRVKNLYKDKYKSKDKSKDKDKN